MNNTLELLKTINKKCCGIKMNINSFNDYFTEKTKGNINLSCWDMITVKDYDNKIYIYNGLLNEIDFEIRFKIIDDSELSDCSLIEISSIK